MADEGTLATTAQVLLAIGENASSTQILEANTNYWIKYAEAEMSAEAEVDLVANYSSIGTNYKQFLASVAAARAAMHAISQNVNTWGISTTQTKLNLLNTIWQDGLRLLRKPDVLALIGAS